MQNGRKMARKLWRQFKNINKITEKFQLSKRLKIREKKIIEEEKILKFEINDPKK